ncbi:hypothetical protein B9Z65_2602 [Elsinoe australis]|uniref:Pre-mRNA-splicing factor n=1 Tax=Elsinoe australis TaxID=40998 RepID=A0A2P8A439_9PEZI|nr:hypothetical protein B9Z65_2602 [Elsinoe australis]
MSSGLSISFGGAAASSTSSKTNGTSAPKANGTKRPHASLGDSDDEDGGPAKQVVTHFGTKGAVNATAPKQDKGPLVIKPQANRDWRDASKAARAEKRAKYGLPPEDGTQDAKAREEQIKKFEDAKKPIWGLNVKKNGETNGNSHGENQVEDEAPNGNSVEEQPQEEAVNPRTDDERAMDALMGIKQTSDLTIPAANEEEAFARDYKTAPDMATLDQYAATPVEEFGAALLRGMGWKEGFGIGTQKAKKLEKSKQIERRPALLGIGAKEDAAVKEEMGAWGRGAKRSDQVYNPIVMRNKKTGEELTESELKERVSEQEAKQKEAELDALASRRKEDDREKRKKEERRRREEDSDEEYERRRREKRRERARDERDYDRKERRRSRDRGESRKDRDRDDRRDTDRRRHCDDRDDRERHRRRDHRDDRYDDDRRRRY